MAGRNGPSTPQTPDANGQFGAAADDFQQKFIEALDLSTWQAGKLWVSGDKLGSIRGILGDRPTDQVLDAFAEADPSTASLMAKIKAEPELATALHKALVQDETMLTGFAEMRDPNSSEINLADIEKTLENPLAVKAMTNLLEKVADGSTVPGTDTDVSFTHVQKVLSDYKKDGVQGAVIAMQETGVDLPAGEMSGEVLMQFFSDLMRDPSMAVNNLMETMVEYGQMDIEQANMLKGFMQPFAGFAKFAAEPYVEYAQKYGLTPGKFKETLATAKGSAQEAGEELGEKYGTGEGANIYGSRDLASYKAHLESAQKVTDKGVDVEVADLKPGETRAEPEVGSTFDTARVGDVTQSSAFGGTDPQVAAGAKPATLDAA